MASDAGVLNAAQVTALIRSDSGFRFWGNRTCADDPLFVFESTVRVAQLLADTVARGMVWAMDKDLTPSLARDIVETVNGFFLDLKTSGVILGAKAWFDETDNPVDSLRRASCGSTTIMRCPRRSKTSASTSASPTATSPILPANSRRRAEARASFPRPFPPDCIGTPDGMPRTPRT
jgi:hypothetical protein